MESPKLNKSQSEAVVCLPDSTQNVRNLRLRDLKEAYQAPETRVLSFGSCLWCGERLRAKRTKPPKYCPGDACRKAHKRQGRTMNLIDHEVKRYHRTIEKFYRKERRKVIHRPLEGISEIAADDRQFTTEPGSISLLPLGDWDILREELDTAGTRSAPKNRKRKSKCNLRRKNAKSRREGFTDAQIATVAEQLVDDLVDEWVKKKPDEQSRVLLTSPNR